MERFEFLKKDYVQGFPANCGFEVERVDYGIFESRLKICSVHQQQDGFVTDYLFQILLKAGHKI